jgi:predicted RNase H-like HicB family nuclease
MSFTVEIDRETDGRWIAEIPDLPGVMVYGATLDQALARVKALALRVIADRLEHGEALPELSDISFVIPAA